MKNLLVFLVMLVCAAPAWADIDHQCLKLCKNGGGASAKCLTQCTFGVSDPVAIGTAKLQTQNMGTSHNVFTAPKPTNELLLAKPTIKLPETSKDYTCVNECLRTGGRYQLCNDRCMRATCAPGSPVCRDLLGKAPDMVLPGGSPSDVAAAAGPGANVGKGPGIGIGTSRGPNTSYLPPH